MEGEQLMFEQVQDVPERSILNNLYDALMAYDPSIVYGLTNKGETPRAVYDLINSSALVREFEAAHGERPSPADVIMAYCYEIAYIVATVEEGDSDESAVEA